MRATTGQVATGKQQDLIRRVIESGHGSTIEHINDVILTEKDGMTVVQLNVTITNIGAKAKMAAFGMKWGYKAALDKLEKQLSRH